METSTMVSSTVSVRWSRSRWRGLRAMSSPQRRPVLIAVSTISRCCVGQRGRGWRRTRSGVRVRVFFLTLLGSSVWAQGLKVTTRSTRARSKTECSMVWYLPTDAAERPFVGGGGDPALDLGGEDLAHRPSAEERDEVLVQVGPVGRQGGGLDLLGGQPHGLDVLGEGDLAAGVVVPGAVADLGLLAVGGALGGAAGGEGAGGALPAFGVAVAGHEPLVAVVGDAWLRPTPWVPPERLEMVDVRTVSANVAPKLSERSAKVGGNSNVALTCDFTLTVAHSRAWRCEAVGEAGTALITQRSQVQILPPLQSETAGQSRVRGSPRARFLRSMSAAMSADIASRWPEWARSAKNRRRLAKVCGGPTRVTSWPVTQRSSAPVAPQLHRLIRLHVAFAGGSKQGRQAGSCARTCATRSAFPPFANRAWVRRRR